MYVVVVEFSARPRHADAFKRRVRQQAQDSLEREPGCHVFDVCIDPERDNFVLLYEVYSDRAAFDAHLASPHFMDFDASVRGWIDDKKVATYQKI
ncbi:MAG: antibiotic biosynthesis monooxygenase [Gammaproteobacteria bacterium]|nr:antibiotic biosynthesis monooxygenase [Gammaproteobacteria bacterium]